MSRQPSDLGSAAARLRHAREHAGHSSAAAFAAAAGVPHVTYRAHENGTRNLTVSAARRYAPHLGVAWQWLMFGEDGTAPLPAPAPVRESRHPARQNCEAVAELDLQSQSGEGLVGLTGPQIASLREAATAVWDIPADYLRNELRVSAGSTCILSVRGDSMEPLLQPGDRVMVNIEDRSPSPPGIFALWDGMGVVVKRVEHIIGTEPPRLLISAENARHQSYERAADDVRIIGRVVWFARRT
jgi:hypothetical protein